MFISDAFSERFNKSFEESISGISTNELIKVCASLFAFEAKMSVDEYNFFPFVDFIPSMQVICAEECFIRLRDFLHTDGSVKDSANDDIMVERTWSVDALRHRYCEKCKDIKSGSGCKGCPVFNRFKKIEADSAIKRDLTRKDD